MKFKPAILHIITRLDLGGAQKSCLALIKELQTQYPDFEIYLISGTTGPLVPQAQQLKNVYLLPSLVWEIKPQNLFLEIKNFYLIWQIMRKLKQQHGDLIVHTHTIKAGVIGRWAALLAGAQTRIHTIHGYAFHPYQNKLVWLSFYLSELICSFITTKFICVSQADLIAGCEIFPRFKQKSSLIRAATVPAISGNATPQQAPYLSKLSISSRLPHPTPLYELHRVRNDVKSLFIIGTIASLKPGKNLFELLKAFKLACQTCPNLKLEIVGGGPLNQALKDQISQLQLAEKVTLVGWAPEPRKYLQNWQIFAFTSLWEGLPCAIVEAHSLGLPILAYQVGGIGDLVPPEQLYPIGGWSQLARGIQALYYKQNPPSSNSLPADFQIAKMALDHVNLYKTTSL